MMTVSFGVLSAFHGRALSHTMDMEASRTPEGHGAAAWDRTEAWYDDVGNCGLLCDPTQQPRFVARTNLSLPLVNPKSPLKFGSLSTGKFAALLKETTHIDCPKMFRAIGSSHRSAVKLTVWSQRLIEDMKLDVLKTNVGRAIFRALLAADLYEREVLVLTHANEPRTPAMILALGAKRVITVTDSCVSEHPQVQTISHEIFSAKHLSNEHMNYETVVMVDFLEKGGFWSRNSLNSSILSAGGVAWCVTKSMGTLALGFQPAEAGVRSVDHLPLLVRNWNQQADFSKGDDSFKVVLLTKPALDRLPSRHTVDAFTFSATGCSCYWDQQGPKRCPCCRGNNVQCGPEIMGASETKHAPQRCVPRGKAHLCKPAKQKHAPVVTLGDQDKCLRSAEWGEKHNRSRYQWFHWQPKSYLTWNLMGNVQIEYDTVEPSGFASRASWVLGGRPQVWRLVYKFVVFGDTQIAPTSIFVSPEFGQHFHDYILPCLPPTSRFVLIFGDSDYSTPLQLDVRRSRRFINSSSWQTLLQDPRILHMFVEHLDHVNPAYVEKVTPLPLGFNPQEFRHLDVDAALNLLVYTVDLATKPLIVVYCNRRRPGQKQFQMREKVYQLCTNATSPWFHICHASKFSKQDFAQLIQKYAFMPCVRGGGIDPNPMAFTALLAGVIPIFQSFAGDTLYNSLPVVIIDEWSPTTISAEKLLSWRKVLAPYFSDAQKRVKILHQLHADFWWQKVERASKGLAQLPAYETIAIREPCDPRIAA